MKAAQWFISHRYRCICVGSPKVASTTLLGLFINWHTDSVEHTSSTRPFLRRREVRERLADAGFQLVSVPRSELVGLVEDHRGYFFFCFVRNPYSRVASCYRDKLNRYARAYARRAYYLGKLCQLVALHKGPEASHQWAVDRMRSWISFSDFLHGLARHGIDFDRHYMSQTRITCPDIVPYDYVGKLESFDEGVGHIKREVGIPGLCGGPDQPAAKLNATSGRRVSAVYTDHLRDVVSKLYQADFQNFGYPV